MITIANTSCMRARHNLIPKLDFFYVFIHFFPLKMKTHLHRSCINT